MLLLLLLLVSSNIDGAASIWIGIIRVVIIVVAVATVDIIVSGTAAATTAHQIDAIGQFIVIQSINTVIT